MGNKKQLIKDGDNEIEIKSNNLNSFTVGITLRTQANGDNNHRCRFLSRSNPQWKEGQEFGSIDEDDRKYHLSSVCQKTIPDIIVVYSNNPCHVSFIRELIDDRKL